MAGSEGTGLSVLPGEEEGESAVFTGLFLPDRLGTAKGAGEEHEMVFPSLIAPLDDVSEEEALGLDELGVEVDGD